MTSYFEDFKKSMKQRLRIPVSPIDKHFNDVCFLVDVDFTYVQASIPMLIWVIPLPYEINVDETIDNWLMRICNCCYLWKHMMYMLIGNLINKYI